MMQQDSKQQTVRWMVIFAGGRCVIFAVSGLHILTKENKSLTLP